MRKFIFGLLAGLTAGVLFAPKSGKALRKELLGSDDKFAVFSKNLQAMGSDASAEAQKVIKSQEIQKLLKQGTTAAGDLLDTLERKAATKSSSLQKELGTIVDSAWKNAKKTGKKITKEVSKKVIAKKPATKKTAKKATKKKVTKKK